VSTRCIFITGLEEAPLVREVGYGLSLDAPRLPTSCIEKAQELSPSGERCRAPAGCRQPPVLATELRGASYPTSSARPCRGRISTRTSPRAS